VPYNPHEDWASRMERHARALTAAGHGRGDRDFDQLVLARVGEETRLGMLARLTLGDAEWIQLGGSGAFAIAERPAATKFMAELAAKMKTNADGNHAAVMKVVDDAVEAVLIQFRVAKPRRQAAREALVLNYHIEAGPETGGRPAIRDRAGYFWPIDGALVAIMYSEGLGKSPLRMATGAYASGAEMDALLGKGFDAGELFPVDLRREIETARRQAEQQRIFDEVGRLEQDKKERVLAARQAVREAEIGVHQAEIARARASTPEDRAEAEAAVAAARRKVLESRAVVGEIAKAPFVARN